GPAAPSTTGCPPTSAGAPAPTRPARPARGPQGGPRFDLARDAIDVRTVSPYFLGLPEERRNALARREVELTGPADYFSVPVDFARRFGGFDPVPVRPPRPARAARCRGQRRQAHDHVRGRLSRGRQPVDARDRRGHRRPVLAARRVPLRPRRRADLPRLARRRPGGRPAATGGPVPHRAPLTGPSDPARAARASSRTAGEVEVVSTCWRALRYATAKASPAGTAMSGCTPVPSQLVPVTGLTERAIGTVISSVGVTGNTSVGCAPPRVVSPI